MLKFKATKYKSSSIAHWLTFNFLISTWSHETWINCLCVLGSISTSTIDLTNWSRWLFDGKAPLSDTFDRSTPQDYKFVVVFVFEGQIQLFNASIDYEYSNHISYEELSLCSHILKIYILMVEISVRERIIDMKSVNFVELVILPCLSVS